MKRREFLKYSGLVTTGLLSPQLFAQLKKQNKILILVELKGGNDGLNTLVPYRDPLYQSLRPNLRLSSEDILPISESLGLHKSLQFLHSQFKREELAIFQSVGYQEPNLSHFRSIDIWETASTSDEFLFEGWVSKGLKHINLQESISKGVVLGDFNLGPLRGSTSDILVIDNPKKLSRSTQLGKTSSIPISNNALSHVLKVENQLNIALQKIKEKTDKKLVFENSMKGGKLQRDIGVLLQMLAIDSNIPFFKLSHGGYDTHTAQKSKHANLLKQLDQGLEKLIKGLKSLGLYNDTLILTYSEFGRSLIENGNQGTDHGTANCHFALGGKVRGSLYGHGYDLKTLQRGHLIATTDFRVIYQSVLSDWWDSKIKIGSSQKSFNFLK